MSLTWQNLFAFLFVLGVLIFVHEFGHYAVAKALGIRVEIFSLGFGPRLIGWRRRGTDYRISVLPVGGYVKLAGESHEEGRTGASDEFLARPRHERFLVLVMGATLNVVLAVGIWWLLLQAGIPEPVYYQEAALVGDVEPDSPAAQAGLAPGDRILSIDGMPVATWKELGTEVTLSPGQHKTIEIERQGARLTLGISLSAHTPYQLGYAGIVPREGVLVRALLPGQPAERAGLRPGDEILEVDGRRIHSRAELSAYVRRRPGQELVLVLARAGERLERRLTVATAKEGGFIGVALDVPTRLQRYAALPALRESLATAWESSGLMFRVLRGLIRGELSPRTMSGPIDIYKFVGIAWEQGAVPFFQLMAGISLQLGLINLLPIPVLDGGHILVLLIEGGMRRDLDLRVKERVMQAGLAFLVLVMGMVLYWDVVKNWL